MRRVALMIAAVGVLGTGCVVTTHDCNSDAYGSMTVQWDSFTDSLGTTFTTCEAADVDAIDVLVDGEPVGSAAIACNSPNYEGIIDGIPAGNHTVSVQAINSSYQEVFYQADVSVTIATCQDTLVSSDLDAVQGPFSFDILDNYTGTTTTSPGVGYYLWYSFTDSTGLTYLVDVDHDPWTAPFYENPTNVSDGVLTFPHFPFGNSTFNWMIEVYYNGTDFETVAVNCKSGPLGHVAANDGATVLLVAPYAGCP